MYSSRIGTFGVLADFGLNASTRSVLEDTLFTASVCFFSFLSYFAVLAGAFLFLCVIFFICLYFSLTDVIKKIVLVSALTYGWSLHIQNGQGRTCIFFLNMTACVICFNLNEIQVMSIK